jgi:hypothetical protein
MRRLLVSAVLSFSLIASSTAAAASTVAAPAPVSAPNAWMALSMLTPSGALALEGTAAAAAQTDTPPPPPPPPPSAGFPTPPIPVIAVWLAVIALDIWILTKNHSARHLPNSPA